MSDTPWMTNAFASGPCQPPRNRVTVTIDMMVMPAYSFRKNMPKRMPEYSVP